MKKENLKSRVQTFKRNVREAIWQNEETIMIAISVTCSALSIIVSIISILMKVLR